MLEKQLQTWAEYHQDVARRFRFIVVDDCSPEPAEPIIRGYGLPVELYRIDVDVPWNMHMACNLGAHVAEGWIVRTDLDHVLIPERAAQLLEFQANQNFWYRFNRESLRGGAIIPRKIHVNSLLIHRDLYWLAGGYDEDYAGYYYGDMEFFYNLQKVAKLGHIQIALRTYKDIPDSTTPFLSRNPDRAIVIRARKKSRKAKNPLRLPWHRVL